MVRAFPQRSLHVLPSHFMRSSQTLVLTLNVESTRQKISVLSMRNAYHYQTAGASTNDAFSLPPQRFGDRTV